MYFSYMENTYMHSSKVADCLLYDTFFNYMFQILADGSCLCKVVSVIMVGDSVKHTALYTTMMNNGSMK